MKFYIAGRQNVGDALRQAAEYLDNWHDRDHSLSPDIVSIIVDIQEEGCNGEWIDGRSCNYFAAGDGVRKVSRRNEGFLVLCLRERIRNWIPFYEKNLLYSKDEDEKERERLALSVLRKAVDDQPDECLIRKERRRRGKYDFFGVCAVDMDGVHYGIRIADGWKLDVRQVPMQWSPGPEEYLYLGRFDRIKTR